MSEELDKPRAMPRWSLTVVAGLHAVVFAWAGAKLPWSDWSTFALLCWLVALGHFATAIAAAAKVRLLGRIWQVASVLSLLVFAALSWSLLRSAAYVAGLYGDLGQGIGAGMLAVIVLLATLTVPLSAWGLAATWRSRYRKRAAAASGVLLVAISLGGWREAAAARAQPLPTILNEEGKPTPMLFMVELQQQRAELIPSWEALPAIPREGKKIVKVPGGHRRERLWVPSLLTTEPIDCVPDPEANVAVAVLTYLVPRREPEAVPSKSAPVEPITRCVTAVPDQLPRAILEHIRREAQRGPVKVDIILGVAPLRSRGPVLDMLALRPGLDGVCDTEHCLMPWQLVAGDLFVANEPLAWIPDFRFGVSPVALRKALGFEVPPEVERWDREQRHAGRLAKLIEQGKASPKPADADAWLLLEGLTRIETLSLVFDDGGKLYWLERGHERDVELSRKRLDEALELAERHQPAQERKR